MRTSLASLASLLLVVPAPAQGVLGLTACGASLGQSLAIDVIGAAPNAFYLLFFSGTSGPIYLNLVDPRDPRRLEVGLDLLSLLQVGSFDGNGRATVNLPLPADPSLAGFGLHLQALEYPGTSWLFGGLSNPAIVDLDLANRWRDRNIAVTTARAYATTLPRADGTQWLVGGGTGALLGLVGQRTTEIYDPATRAWIAGPNLTVERAGHTSTPLPDGRVLVACGVNVTNDPQQTTEFLDAAGTQFTAGAQTFDKRFGHTATWSPITNTVMLAGGLSDLNNQLQAIGSTVDTIEVYDVVANSWTNRPILHMARPRAGHTAHTLPDGRILLVGGISWTLFIGLRVPTTLRDCEIYDPVTHTLTGARAMNQARALHSAVALADGRILVTGGSTGTPGISDNTTATAEIYDWRNNTWTTVASMASTRGGHGIALLHGGTGVLVVGGGQGPILTPSPISACEVYDSVANAWTPAPSMAATRAAFALFELQGCVPYAVSGGSTGAVMTATTEFFYR